MNAPILNLYLPQGETELHCDGRLQAQRNLEQFYNNKKRIENFTLCFISQKEQQKMKSSTTALSLKHQIIVYALRRFRIYLLDIKFKIITDCQILSLTLKKKKLILVARWILEMQNYDYILEHRTISLMLHVDTLSRQIFVVKDKSFDKNLVLCQDDDPAIRKIWKEQEQLESKFFKMRNGLVYKKH